MIRSRTWPMVATTLLAIALAAGCDRPATVPTEAGVDNTALADLIRGLKLRDAAARSRCAITIGRMGPAAKEAVRALTAALKDRDAGVRAASAYSLGQIGPEAKSALTALESLKGQPATREVATKAIEKIGG
ncbi:HEAT repeat domain-containing protein [Singulisphaera sp. PoT]|uniref:HEAT repeat domain-containing protein n=1 Tax=Singulisphaera sp. PoT TaxID=3411797 RepID=UPI003BF4E112